MGCLRQSVAEIMSKALHVWWVFDLILHVSLTINISNGLMLLWRFGLQKSLLWSFFAHKNHPHIWNPDLQKEEEEDDGRRQTKREDGDRMGGVRRVRGEWMDAFCTQHSYLLWVYHLWGNMNANRLKKSVSLQKETGEQQEFEEELSNI